MRYLKNFPPAYFQKHIHQSLVAIQRQDLNYFWISLMLSVTVCSTWIILIDSVYSDVLQGSTLNPLFFTIYINETTDSLSVHRSLHDNIFHQKRSSMRSNLSPSHQWLAFLLPECKVVIESIARLTRFMLFRRFVILEYKKIWLIIPAN